MKPIKTTENRIHHPLIAQDAEVVEGLRAHIAPFKGKMVGPHARENYALIFEAIPAADGVLYEQGQIGGVLGVWCRPDFPLTGAAILYLHGGAYVLGSAHAYRHMAGHFAARTRLPVFVADYRLAPEYPFPAALEDAQAAYRGLLEAGHSKLIVVGDSAGGGLGLSLISHLEVDLANSVVKPVAAVVMSPWSDMALTGNTLEGNAVEDPMLTREMLAANASLYLGHQDSIQSKASPLYAPVHDLPPLQIHVGTSEILLDDSLRYSDRANDAGAAVTVHVWQGMPHVFPTMIGALKAADEAMGIMASFINDCMKFEQPQIYGKSE
jgi:monoterpene epsilon-lactone hydrolase